MNAAELGPITEKMYERGEDEAPAIIKEWGSKLKQPGDFIVSWSGVLKHHSGNLGWGAMTVHFGEGRESTSVKAMSATKVERLLAPLAHEGRVRIMQALFDGPLSASELGEASGLQGGALYHHLKDLQYSSYVVQEDRRYRLTRLGYELLITVLCMANEVIADKSEEGLGVADKWDELKRV